MSKTTPAIEPALLTVEQTYTYLGIGKTLFYSMQSSARFGVLPLRLGKRVLYRRAELDSYIEAGMPSRKVWQEIKKQRGFE